MGGYIWWTHQGFVNRAWLTQLQLGKYSKILSHAAQERFGDPFCWNGFLLCVCLSTILMYPLKATWMLVTIVSLHKQGGIRSFPNLCTNTYPTFKQCIILCCYSNVLSCSIHNIKVVNGISKQQFHEPYTKCTHMPTSLDLGSSSI